MSRNAKPRNALEAHDQERALAVLAKMRRDRASLRAAAKAYGTNIKIVKLYVGSALRKDSRGRYRPTHYDRIPRTLNLLTDKGAVPLTVRDSRTASRIADHSNAIREYRHRRDPSVLKPFKGKSFRAGGTRYQLVTVPEVIDQLDDAGELSAIESLYYARTVL